MGTHVMAHYISQDWGLENGLGSLVSLKDLTFNRGGTKEDCSACCLLARMREASGSPDRKWPP